MVLQDSSGSTFNNQIFGFTTAIVQVLLIPLDVGNYRSDFGLSMYTVWTMFLYTNAILMILVIPFMLFFYETDNEASVVPASHPAHSPCRLDLLLPLLRFSFRLCFLHRPPPRKLVHSRRPTRSARPQVRSGLRPLSQHPEPHSFLQRLGLDCKSAWRLFLQHCLESFCAPASRPLVTRVIPAFRIHDRGSAPRVTRGDCVFRGVRTAEHLHRKRADRVAIQHDSPVVGTAQEDYRLRNDQPEEQDQEEYKKAD